MCLVPIPTWDSVAVSSDLNFIRDAVESMIEPHGARLAVTFCEATGKTTYTTAWVPWGRTIAPGVCGFGASGGASSFAPDCSRANGLESMGQFVAVTVACPYSPAFPSFGLFNDTEVRAGSVCAYALSDEFLAVMA